MKKLISILLIASQLLSMAPAQAALSEADRALSISRNTLTNPGAEASTAGYVASGGTLTTTTAAGNVDSGNASFSWASSAASQTILSGYQTVNSGDGFSGNSGTVSARFKCATGTCTHKLQAFDGSTVLGEVVITSSTTRYIRSSVNFQYPASGTIGWRLISVSASEPLVYFDGLYRGLAEGFTAGASAGASIVNFIGQSTTWSTTAPSDINLDTSVGNWLAYANTVPGAQPDNGMTGGSPSVTCTRSTTNPLNGAGSLLITKGAANRQGEGCSVVFNVQPSYQGAAATITASLQVVSGTIVQGDVKFFVYDVTNSQLITPFNNDVVVGPNITATFSTTARAGTPANQQYRLGFYFASTAATAVTLMADDFAVSPGIAAYGLAGSNSAAYTPTFVGFGSVSNSNFQYWRTGHFLNVRGSVTSGTNNGSIWTISLPANLQIDYAAGSGLRTDLNLNGVGLASRVSTTTAPIQTANTAILFADGSDATHIFAAVSNSASTTSYSKSTGTNWMASGDSADIYFQVPISGWDSNVTMQQSSQFKISSYLANGTRVTGAAPTQLGQYRSYLRNAGASSLTETNGAPTNPPSNADGIRIDTVSTYAAADPTGFPSAYDIFVGKNKSVKANFFLNTGRTGFLDVTPVYKGTTYNEGLIQSYDPTTGIFSIRHNDTFGNSNNQMGDNGAGGVANNTGYFDITVSENALAVGVQVPRTECTHVGGNGYGSSSTKIPKYTTNNCSGTGVAYVSGNDATLGLVWPIVESGVYCMSASIDPNSASSNTTGFSRNSTQLTTSIMSITAADRLTFSTNNNGTVTSKVHVSACTIANNGDVLRPHTDGYTNDGTATVARIVKVSN